jgi:hypothetical protein
MILVLILGIGIGVIGGNIFKGIGSGDFGDFKKIFGIFIFFFIIFFYIFFLILL